NYFNYQGHIFEIDISVLLDYHNYLKKLKKISLNTKKNKWTILVSFLNFTMEYYFKYGFIVKIPSKTINWNGNHKIANTNKNTIITLGEIEKLLKYFGEGNFKHYVIFRLFTETGMRKGELIKAKLSNVNFKYRHVKIEDGKTGLKYYGFTEKFAQKLRLYVNMREELKVDYDNLFLTHSFKPYSNRPFNLFLKIACEKLGIEKNITTHTFRRSINTHRKKLKKCPNEICKRLLGHKTIDVNEASYTIYDFEDLIELYDQYNPYENL
ncbi:unnamed protein product, partial [marine sediment metagenome]